MNNVWRYIDGGACSAEMNMAIDEAIATAVLGGISPPTLRIYAWDRPSVTLGHFQKHTDVDVAFCTAEHIPVVRRLTGGRAILHGDDITYSFSARNTDHVSFRSLLSSYETLSRAFVAALTALGCPVSMRRGKERGRVLSRNPACFETVSFGEIAVHNRKIVGSAQKRFRGGFLQQGNLPLRRDSALQARVFGGVRITSSALDEVLPDVDIGVLKKHIRKSFEMALGAAIQPGELSRAERETVPALLARKYRSREWTEFR